MPMIPEAAFAMLDALELAQSIALFSAAFLRKLLRTEYLTPIVILYHCHEGIRGGKIILEAERG